MGVTLRKIEPRHPRYSLNPVNLAVATIAFAGITSIVVKER